ncbi:hypothetical protein ACLQ24_00105 [Micromonospora sp. DT4]|uniref:hypothetical protein n=1 Tax=Micromonospora sp. DT4 TaxID=3393438 RepID=UPI003CF8F7E0
MDAQAPADPVKRAKAAAEARIALVGTAHKRAEKINSMLARLQEEHGLYGQEYQAALAAWSRDDLEGFGLVAPDQIAVTGSARRSIKKPNA